MAKELTALRERLTRGENIKDGESNASKEQVVLSLSLASPIYPYLPSLCLATS